MMIKAGQILSFDKELENTKGPFTRGSPIE